MQHAANDMPVNRMSKLSGKWQHKFSIQKVSLNDKLSKQTIIWHYSGVSGVFSDILAMIEIFNGNVRLCPSARRSAAIA